MLVERKEIEKSLKKVPANVLRDYYKYFIDTVMMNPDFILTEILYYKEDGLHSDTVADIKTEAFEQSISRETLNTLREYAKRNRGRLKKPEIVEAFSEFLLNEAFMEAICLFYADAKPSLDKVMKDLGVYGPFRRVLADPVYQKRENYLRKVRQAIVAAMNLYGAVSYADALSVFKHYEADLLSDMEGYERESGSYRKTTCFKPCNELEVFSYLLIWLQKDRSQFWFNATFDKFLVHRVFMDAVREESFNLDEDEDYYDDKLIRVPIHRRVIWSNYEGEAVKKERYYPLRNDFYHYFDMERSGILSDDEKNLVGYVRKTFGMNDEYYISPISKLDDSDLLAWFKGLLTAWNGKDDADSFITFIDSFGDLAAFLEIYYDVDSEDDMDPPVSDILHKLFPVYHTSRLWNEKGMTRDEAKAPVFSDVMFDKLVDVFSVYEDNRHDWFDDYDEDYDEDDYDEEDDDLLTPDTGRRSEKIVFHWDDDDLPFN